MFRGEFGAIIVVGALIGVLAVAAIWQLGAIADDLERTSPRARFTRGWSRARAWRRNRRRDRKPGADL